MCSKWSIICLLAIHVCSDARIKTSTYLIGLVNVTPKSIQIPGEHRTTLPTLRAWSRSEYNFSGGTAVAYVSKISLASNLAISFLENKQSCEKTASFSLMSFLFYCYFLFFVLVGNSLIWLIPIRSVIEFISEVLFTSIVYWRCLICPC